MIFLASECGFVGIHVFDAFKVFMDENNSGFINR